MAANVKIKRISAELRRWFGHDAARFAEFRSRYQAELREHSDELAQLAQEAKRGPVTILYGARDTQHNNAVVLAEPIDQRLRRR